MIDVKLNPKELITALLSHERKELIASEKIDYQNVNNKWRDRATLTSDSIFSTKLAILGLSEQEFAESITKLEDMTLNEEKVAELVLLLQSKMNFELFSEGLLISEDKKNESEQLDLSLFIRPFLSYISNRLDLMLKGFALNHKADIKNVKEKWLIAIGTQLLTQASRSIVLEMHVSKLKDELYGDTPEDRFQSFIREKAINTEELLKFYEEYATLTRILILRSDFFLNNIDITLKRYSNDFVKLSETFNLANQELDYIDFGLGDTHQKGKTVGKFVYKSGKTIIYKPKGLSISLKYNHLLEWIAKRANFVTLEPYKILDFGTHGWEEMVQYRSCMTEQEVKDYFRRFGVLIGLMHSIKGADFHLENIIASGDTPYIIDHETLFHQSPKLDFPDSVEVQLKYEQADSVVGTGLLPLAMFKNADGKGIDLSALNGKEQELPFKVLKIVSSMTDDMKFTMQSEMFRGAHNLPTLNGKGIDAEDYLDDILFGFKNIFTFFINHKDVILNQDGPISLFKNEKIRIVARATQQYFNFLNESTHPDYMRDILYLENLFDRLWLYPYIDKRIIEHEILDLLEGDIPFFTTRVDSTDLYSSQGARIENVFEESGYQLVKSRIEKYNLEELDLQLGWIKTAIIGTKMNESVIEEEKWVEKELPNIVDPLFLNEARAVADEILSKLVFSKTKDKASLLSLNPNGESNWSVGPALQGLYEGLGGISLFLLYMWKETREEKYKVAAEATLRSAMYPMVESKGLISAFSGPFSLLYPLVHFQKHFNHNEFESKISELKERIRLSVKEDQVFDFLGGAAGISYVLMNVYEMTKDEEYLEIAEQYGEHLLEQAQIVNGDQIAWKHETAYTYLGGFSHGTSGIALSLLRLSHLTKKDKYRELSYKAISYDQSLFDSEKGAWRDNRKSDDSWVHQCCHGSTGIGLSRMIMSIYSNTDKYNDEITQSIHNIRKYGYKNSDTLCHGNFGDIELFLLARNHFNDNSYLNEAKRRGYNILLQKERRGHYQIDGPIGFIQPSLFTGLSGIGLQLLRLYNPDSVPAVAILN
ncbi:type 2 lanthipeptide synthetase LanM family protein [Peribacillus simplex]|uniref:type 2 lanthipeptide synthetase LanM family protein n=1 Tax=Peribacillus simplex TaxID=1478 RepID=UPI0033383BCE